jgi:hypothetical protein
MAQLRLQKDVDYHENILQFRGITKYESGKNNILFRPSDSVFENVERG